MNVYLLGSMSLIREYPRWSSLQEMPLVKLQLRRHKSNEEGDYVTENSYADIAVAGKLPTHHYQDVPCCGNCFKVSR